MNINFYNEVKFLEVSLIMQALERTKNNKTHAASLLGIKRGTLLKKMQSYGMLNLFLLPNRCVKK